MLAGQSSRHAARRPPAEPPPESSVAPHPFSAWASAQLAAWRDDAPAGRAPRYRQWRAIPATVEASLPPHESSTVWDLRGLTPCPLVARRASSELNLPAWRAFLRDFDDQELLGFLTYGFPTGSACSLATVFAHNHGSLRHHIDQTRRDIEEEVLEGKLLSFSSPPFWPLRVSPLGSYPKKRTSKRRRISDLSFPPPLSVNDGVDKAQWPELRYASVCDVANLLARMRAQPGGAALDIHLAKLDIKAAYRQLPLREADWWQTCYYVDGRFLVDTRLPFGLSSAPSHFSRVTRAIVHGMKRLGITVVGYLDDFLVIAPSAEACAAAVARLMSTFRALGLPIQMEKFAREGHPSPVVVFLGVEIDARRMTLRLDDGRLRDLRSDLLLWRSRTVASGHQIASLVGSLAFAARVVAPGRLYMARLIALLRHPHVTAACQHRRRVVLSPGAHLDLAWWLWTMPAWNGVAIIPPLLPTAVPEAQLWSDASNWGFGAYFGDQFCMGPWSELEAAWPIHVKELAALVIAVAVFRDALTGRHLLAHCDNAAVVLAIQRGVAVDERLNCLLRLLHRLSATLSLRLSAAHIAGARNVGADALSRADLTAFRRFLAPCAPVQAAVPSPTRLAWWQECGPPLSPA